MEYRDLKLSKVLMAPLLCSLVTFFNYGLVLGKGAQDSKQWPNDQIFFEGGGGGGWAKLRILECFGGR